MARGVNKVILIGHIGQEPDLRQIPNRGAAVSLSLATSETWKDKQSGEDKERVEWHRVVAFYRLAEIIGQYVNRGSKIYIEGQLRTRKWQKDGVDMYTTEIVASEMQMLDSKQAGTNSIAQAGQSHSKPAETRDIPEFDDDIPF